MNNDLISRKALLDALSNNMVVARGVPKYEWTWVVRVKENIIRVIKELSAADVGPSKQDWISVKDRLPEEGENVLIYTKTNIMFFGMYTKRYGFSEREGFICGDGFMWLSTASHWMPTPEPPKDGE